MPLQESDGVSDEMVVRKILASAGFVPPRSAFEGSGILASTAVLSPAASGPAASAFSATATAGAGASRRSSGSGGDDGRGTFAHFDNIDTLAGVDAGLVVSTATNDGSAAAPASVVEPVTHVKTMTNAASAASMPGLVEMDDASSSPLDRDGFITTMYSRSGGSMPTMEPLLSARDPPGYNETVDAKSVQEQEEYGVVIEDLGRDDVASVNSNTGGKAIDPASGVMVMGGASRDKERRPAARQESAEGEGGVEPSSMPPPLPESLSSMWTAGVSEGAAGEGRVGPGGDGVDEDRILSALRAMEVGDYLKRAVL